MSPLPVELTMSRLPVELTMSRLPVELRSSLKKNILFLMFFFANIPKKELKSPGRREAHSQYEWPLLNMTGASPRGARGGSLKYVPPLNMNGPY